MRLVPCVIDNCTTLIPATEFFCGEHQAIAAQVLGRAPARNPWEIKQFVEQQLAEAAHD
jgi:hypothetical protein